jgi:hypothetical protein
MEARSMAMKEEETAAPRPRPARRCFVFRAPPWLTDADRELCDAVRAPDPLGLSRLLTRRLDLGDADAAAGDLPLLVTHRPLGDEWSADLPEDPKTAAELAARREPATDAALAIRFASEDLAGRFAERAKGALGAFDAPQGDIRLGSALHWGPGRGEGGHFGDLAAARRLIHADALDAEGLDGDGVKVVVVDQGIDASRLPDGTNFMGGWWKPGWPDARPPGQAEKDNRHGTMIARSVLAMAPKAMIFDCPLIPARILGNLPAFLSDAFGAITRMALDIALLGLIRPDLYKGRWVFVNAWSIYDPRGEAVEGEYTRNRYHWVSCAVDHAATLADVVFAAGNCGAFCPDGRCADRVIGPGRSILGANSLDSVLTVAAARADGIWAGYSSQGPGQFPGYGGAPQRKPDLTAPSHVEVLDTAHRLAGGTSAACGIAAGVVAALRTRWSTAALPPAALFEHLRQGARPAGDPGWDNRFGHGVLDCRRTLDRLAAQAAT